MEQMCPGFSRHLPDALCGKYFRPRQKTRAPAIPPLQTRAGKLSLFFYSQPTSAMIGRLSQLLDPSRITLSIQGARRTVAINEVARLLDGHPNVTNFQGFYNELLARERLDTTCLGNEIAIPHARTEHVQKIVLAVGRSNQGVFFENCNQTVKLMFVLGTPKTNPGTYLAIVSALCRLLKEPANREAFMNAPTPEAFIQAVVAAEEKLLGAATH
jgi:mannitol/fructose-specific phosphotransferase system IIA component (Ntr-type)